MESSKTKSDGRWRGRVNLISLSGAYLLGVIIANALLRTLGDRWWVATAGLLFGPRWLLALPALPLLPLCILKRRRALWLLLPALLLLVFGVLGFNVPWGNLLRSAPAAGEPARMRVITCNVHHRSLDAAAFNALLAETSPDVVLLQEWTSQDAPAFGWNADWHFRRDGEFYLASRYPIASGELVRLPGIQPEEMAACYLLDLGGRSVRVYNVHLKSPHKAFEALLGGKEPAQELIDANSRERDLQSWCLRAGAEKSTEPVLLAGDFNTPNESAVFQRHWSAFTDAFTQAGVGIGNTYYSRRIGMRIDHILTGPGWICRACRVCADVGSAHRPVVADILWRAAASK